MFVAVMLLSLGWFPSPTWAGEGGANAGPYISPRFACPITAFYCTDTQGTGLIYIGSDLGILKVPVPVGIDIVVLSFGNGTATADYSGLSPSAPPSPLPVNAGDQFHVSIYPDTSMYPCPSDVVPYAGVANGMPVEVCPIVVLSDVTSGMSYTLRIKSQSGAP
jgi:hypothetical protein